MNADGSDVRQLTTDPQMDYWPVCRITSYNVCYTKLLRRIKLSYEAEAEEIRVEDVVRRLFESVPIP